MKELKSKKTGLIQIISDKDYADMVNKGAINMKNFIVTDLSPRAAMPSIKIPPKKVKNEG